MSVRILLAGGTGLVGGQLTQRLLHRRDVRLDSLVRSPTLGCERKVDFDAIVADPSTAAAQPADLAISCLGTTLRAAGSPERFRRVDYDYIVAFAQLARQAGATRFILVSSVGAGGQGLYLSVKGDTEAAVQALGFDRVDILRPSLLLGPRADRRPAEALAQRAAPALNPFLVGPLARYRALDASIVAAAIETLTSCTIPGVHVHHAPEIAALARL